MPCTVLHATRVTIRTSQCSILFDTRSLAVFRDFEGQHVDSGLLHGSRGGEWEGSSIPSNRVWLGNISATATLQSVRSVFSKFGSLTDAAVFPARIGPLGYAFVNFERVSDAAGAYQALNNVVLPALTGCKQLKMRFKPAKVYPPAIVLSTILHKALTSWIPYRAFWIVVLGLDREAIGNLHSLSLRLHSQLLVLLSGPFVWQCPLEQHVACHAHSHCLHTTSCLHAQSMSEAV